MINHQFNYSEFARLTDVVLFLPQPNKKIEANKFNLLLETLNTSVIHEELNKLIELYKKHHIKTHVISELPAGLSINDLINMIYIRDLFFMTPVGAIIANMGVDIRKKEPSILNRFLNTIKTPVFNLFEPNEAFEGADALWLNAKTVLIGLGKRTNLAGFNRIANFLTNIGVQALKCKVLTNLPQHLLGTIQIVDHNLAIIREKIVDPVARVALLQQGFELINIKESHEVSSFQGMNLITVGPKMVIMPENCPKTKVIYQHHGIKVIETVSIPEIIKGGGGLACLTGILKRD